MKRRTSSLSLLAAMASFAVAGGVSRAEDAPAASPAHKSLIGTRCKDDAAKLCAGIEPGGGKLAKCLRSHDADLAEPCKAALAAADAKQGGGAPAAIAAPAAATPTPAAGAAGPAMAGPGMGGGHHGGVGGGGGGGRGMMDHPMEWGPMKDMRKSCADDVGRFCKDVKPGHGRVAVCLNEHPSDLSPACKKMVDQVMPMMNAPMEAHTDCAADVQRFCGDVPPGVGRVGFCLGEHSSELSPTCKQHIADMKAHWRKRGMGQGAGGAGGASGMGAKPAPPAAPIAPMGPAPAAK